MNNRNAMIFKRLKEHYNYLVEKGYEVVCLMLQGSQNYNLDIYTDEYKSDIDSKAIVLPTLDDIVLNKQAVSTTLILENEEHIDVKDVRAMFEVIEKSNVQYIELLYTDFKIINPKYKGIIKEIFDNRDEILNIDRNKFLSSIVGMSKNKLAALKHPYPTIIDKIEKFGYDPKQLHHIIRLNDLIKKVVAGKPYKECLIPDNIDYLIDIKKGIIPLEEAEKMAKEYDEETYQIRNANIGTKEPNAKGVNILNSVKSRLIKEYFISSLNAPKQNPQYNNIFFTSDNHFYHENIITYENRPFATVEEMNNKMIDLWNEEVKENDLVYILGDFSFGSVKETEELLNKLNGYKILIKGNHDTIVDSRKFNKKLFVEIHDYLERKIRGNKYVLCHYPLPLHNESATHLYGHIHSGNGKHQIKGYEVKGINVGVDVNNFKPININNLRQVR